MFRHKATRSTLYILQQERQGTWWVVLEDTGLFSVNQRQPHSADQEMIMPTTRQRYQVKLPTLLFLADEMDRFHQVLAALSWCIYYMKCGGRDLDFELGLDLWPCSVRQCYHMPLDLHQEWERSDAVNCKTQARNSFSTWKISLLM